MMGKPNHLKQDLIENYDCSYIGEWYDGETVWSPYYYTDTWYIQRFSKEIQSLGYVKKRLGKIQRHADGAGDRTVIEECFFGGHADVFAPTRKNYNAPRPQEQVEADHVKGAHKASRTGTE